MKLDLLLQEAAHVDEPQHRSLGAARGPLDAAIRDSSRRSAAVAQRRRRRRKHRAVMTAVLAAAASLALVVGPSLSMNGQAPPASAAAVQAVLAASQAAGDQPGGWPTANFWYTLSEYREVSRFTERSGESIRRQVWVGRTAAGVLDDPGVSEGIVSLDGPATFSPGALSLTWGDLYALPTDPARLEQKLLDILNSDDRQRLFAATADLLSETPAPPALREALWRVVAEVPNVQLVGQVRDSAGRAGTAVQVVIPGFGSRRMIFSEQDGRLLEQETRQRGNDGESQSFRMTYIAQGPAATAPAPEAAQPSQS
jgi:hypothetical protein